MPTTLTKTFDYEAIDADGKRSKGKLDAPSESAVASVAARAGRHPARHHRGRHRAAARDQPARPQEPRLAEGSRGLRPAVRDDDLVRPVAAALARDPRGTDHQTRTAQGDSGRPPRHRVRAVAVGSDGAAGQDLPAPDDRDGARRRDRRLPRQRARPHRAELREGRLAARQDQVGADLSRHRHLLQHRDDRGRPDLHRPDLREDVHEARRHAAAARRGSW